MKNQVFYIAAGIVLCLGLLLLIKTSAYSRSGGNKFERRRKRRVMGICLIIVGMILATIAIMLQLTGETLMR